MRRRMWRMAAVAATGLLAAHAAARADGPARPDFGLHDPSYVMIGAGWWEAARDTLRTGEVDLTFRPNWHWWIVKPQIGVLAAGDGDYLAFAGPVIDVYLTRQIELSVSTAAGVWGGNGFNLGSRVEFHSGLDAMYRFQNGLKAGIGIYHTSNADLTKRNPGSESALFEVAVPINWMLR